MILKTTVFGLLEFLFVFNQSENKINKVFLTMEQHIQLIRLTCSHYSFALKETVLMPAQIC